MDVDYSPEQQQLRESVRRYLADRAPLTALRETYGVALAKVDAAWSGLCELGVGEDMRDLGVVLEECGRALYPGPIQSLVTGAELLPELQSGERIGALALYEPASGFSWRSPATTVESGQLTGTKAWVPDAPIADVFLVVAADGVYAVEEAEAQIESTMTYDGSRSWSTVTFADAPAQLIRDHSGVERALDRTVVALAADGVGAAGRALELALDYAKTREQFGKPIGAFQAVQHLCADMLQLLEMGRAGTHYALWALDEADPAEAHRAATMAKAYTSDAFPRIGALAIQVFGGVGFTWEHDIHLYYKRLLGNAAAYGNAPHHLEELAGLV